MAFDVNSQNAANILQCYYEAEKAGNDLRSFLKESDLLSVESKIAFYAIDEFGAMVYRICKKANIHFSCILSDEDRTINCSAHDNAVKSLECRDIKTVDSNEYNYLFAGIIWDPTQISILQQNCKCGCALFDTVTLHLYTKSFYIDKIAKFVKLNPQIKTGLFIIPHTYDLTGELTELEEYFTAHPYVPSGVCAIKDEEIRERFKQKCYRDYGFNDEYINEVCNIEYNFKSYDEIVLLENHLGTYSNVINHRRNTTDNPDKYKNTVYFFGDSCAISFNVGDSETMESALQRIINKNGLSLCVQNCANMTGLRYDYLFPLLESMQFKPGDIILFCAEVDYLTKQRIIANDQKFFKGALAINTLSLFNHPRNYGEVFSDDHHFNSKGNELIAEKIFVDLQAANYFSDNYVNPNISSDDDIELHEGKKDDVITAQYSVELNKYLDSIKPYRPKIGSIVMNCNPFTLGHRHLVEFASKRVERLYVFVVEEDKSKFPFEDRFELVKKGTADLENVVVLPSGKFIVSALTFQAYFDKSNLQNTIIDPSEEVEIFAKEIAPAMGITVRFAGEEPLDNVTRQYNASMKHILPQYGIEFVEIPRKEKDEEVISASRVRNLLESKDFDEISKLVPKTTLEYIVNKFG